MNLAISMDGNLGYLKCPQFHETLLRSLEVNFNR